MAVTPMVIKFTVYGEPGAKGRPKFTTIDGHAVAYTPKGTALYENLVRTEFQRQCGGKRFADDDMLDFRVLAYFAIPKSESQKKKAAMERGEIRPTKKPDADNVLKIVADSLNKLAYADDKQIVDTQIRKFYSHKPRVEITIRTA